MNSEHPSETKSKTDDELIQDLIRKFPLQCAGCTNEILFGEPALSFTYAVGYSIQRSRHKEIPDYARYDNVLRKVHLKCLHLVPEQF